MLVVSPGLFPAVTNQNVICENGLLLGLMSGGGSGKQMKTDVLLKLGKNHSWGCLWCICNELIIANIPKYLHTVHLIKKQEQKLIQTLTQISYLSVCKISASVSTHCHLHCSWLSLSDDSIYLITFYFTLYYLMCMWLGPSKSFAAFMW